MTHLDAPHLEAPHPWPLRVSARIALFCRATFDRLALKSAPVVVVIGALAIAGAVQFAISLWQKSVCQISVPIDPIRLQATFSVRQFDALIAAEASCRGVIPIAFFADIAFCLAYPIALVALFLWSERWRRFEPNDIAITAPGDSTRRDLLIAAPFAAAFLDAVPEDILLGAASVFHRLPLREVLVVVGSFGAAAKWTLLALFAWGLGAEVLSGPRGQALRMLRFSLFGAILTGIPLLAIPQGQDVLERIVEDDRPFLAVASCVFALVFVGTIIWYCGRKLVQLRMALGDRSRDGIDTDNEWFQFHAEYLPRVFGTGAIATSAAALARAGLALPVFIAIALVSMLVVWVIRRTDPNPEHLDHLTRRRAAAIAAALLALVLMCGYAFFTRDSVSPEIARLRFASGVTLAAAWGFFFWVQNRRFFAQRSSSGEGQKIDPLRAPKANLDGVSLAAKIGVVVSITFLLLFAFVPVGFARAIGPLWVLAITAANAVFVGTLLVRVSAQYRFPFVRFMLVLAAVFSKWNDNHLVRTLSSKPDTNALANAVAGRPDFREFYQRWRTANVADASGPIVLVAAAGGGLRASYWASIALGSIADRDSTFTRRLFAISGVSGGSLGGAFFASLLHDSLTTHAALPCALRPTPAPPDSLFQRCVHRLFRDDYLSPVLAMLAAPDIAQRFLPIPIAAFDRSIGLEDSWSESYRRATGKNTFGNGLLALGDSASPATTPLLVLNTTHVETGRRFVASPVRLDGVVFDAGDTYRALGGRVDLSEAAAVHNSARFTFVSPPGRLSRADTLGHVVDGGYFENSGLATVQDLLNAIPHDSSGRASGRQLVVVYLCNDPIACADDRRQPPRDSSEKIPPSLGTELAGPVSAVLNARSARGSLARAQLIKSVGTAQFIQLNVCPDSVPLSTPTAKDSLATTAADTSKVDPSVKERSRDRAVSPPLGWLLSRLARDWMDGSIRPDARPGDGRCRRENVNELRRLHDMLMTPIGPH